MLGSLFRKRFAKLVARGDRLAAQGELGLARGEYAVALQAFREGDDPAERARVEARLTEIHRELARRQLEDGRRYAGARLWDQARHAFEAARDLARGHDEAATKEAEEALANLEEAAERARLAAEAEDEEPEDAPPDPDAEMELLIQTFPEDRIAAYRALGPDFRDGYLALHDGDGAAALAAFDRVEADEPWLDYERGRALLLQDRPADAVAAFRRAAERIDGEAAPPVVADLALAAIAAGELETAEAAVDRFAALEGERSREALTLRVELERAAGRHDDAIARVRRFLADHPSDAAMWRALGTLQEEAERPEAAIEAYEQVMKLRWRFDPQRRIIQLDPAATSRLARLLIDRGERLDRALELVNALDLLTPPGDKWGIALLRADALRAAGRADEAAGVLDAALESLPADAPTEARERLTAARSALEP